GDREVGPGGDEVVEPLDVGGVFVAVGAEEDEALGVDRLRGHAEGHATARDRLIEHRQALLGEEGPAAVRRAPVHRHHAGEAGHRELVPDGAQPIDLVEHQQHEGAVAEGRRHHPPSPSRRCSRRKSKTQRAI
ncbi:MAG: hypothetical protein ACK559_33300, partial [bacterium]